MHRTARGASRHGHARSAAALADVPAVAALAQSRSAIQVLPRLAATTAKLPELRKPACARRGGSVDERGSPRPSSVDMLSGREQDRAQRTRPDIGASDVAASRLCPPPPPPEPIGAESDPSPTHGPTSLPRLSTLPDRRGTTEAAVGASPVPLGTVESLLAQQHYAESYLVASSYLTSGGSADGAAAERCRAQLLGYRCLSSFALLRFTECCEDGAAALSLYGRLGCAWGTSELPAASTATAAAAASPVEAVPLRVRVVRALLGALVMRELYADAAELLARQPCVEDGDVDCGADSPPPFATWETAVPAISNFRECVAARRWSEAVHIVDGSDAARRCIEATPLCAMLGFVRVEHEEPVAARGLLLHYLASLPEPPAATTLSALPAEHTLLWENYTSHYVFATTLLAKASFMCGSAYLNIAAALLQRVLRLRAAYTPARLFAELVLTYEARQQRLDTAVAAGDHREVLAVTAELLRVREVPRLVQAEVYLTRTQAQWMRRQPLEVVQEASQCVERDPGCALALRLRADAFAVMGRAAEAAADRAAATHALPRVDAVFAELQAQRSRSESARAAAEVRPRPVPVFASAQSVRPKLSPSAARGRAGDESPTSCPLPPPPPPLRTHYEVLGVANSASAADIRQCYRRLTLQCHPDRLVGATEAARRTALAAFQLLGNAYTVLADAQLRAAYDAELSGLR
ncbi:DnaJ domain containing protein [Novymonas esmeraldas]|uniref:DnaJ domain containing protein n=1 Tax=Novymonas esmeraldas TaxID=1808958 RepID=A0AAW0ESD1_9TRYP